MINKDLLCTQLYVNTRVPKKFLKCVILDALQNHNYYSQEECYSRLKNLLNSMPKKSIPSYILQVLLTSVSKHLPIQIATDLLHNVIYYVDGKIQDDILIELFNKYHLSTDKPMIAKLIYSHMVSHYSSTKFPSLSLVNLEDFPSKTTYMFSRDGLDSIVYLNQDKNTNKLYTDNKCFIRYLPMTRKYNTREVTYHCSITPPIKVILDAYQKEGVMK